MPRSPRRKPLPYRVRVLLALLSAGMLLVAWSFFPAAVEVGYSHGVYPFFANVTQFFFKKLPFSFGDVVYVLLVLLAGTAIVRVVVLLGRRKPKQAGQLLLGLLNGFLSLVLVFYLFWGMNYFREPASRRFGFSDDCCAVGEIKAITGMMIDSANKYRTAIGRTGIKKSKADIYAAGVAAVKLLPKLDPQFRVYAPAIKPSLFGDMISFMGTSGYYNPLTSESQINAGIPAVLKPFTVCHELSHQAGFATEDEASFGGFLAAVNSPDTLSRYSAYYSALGEYLFELRLQDTVAFKEMRDRLLPAVRRDFKRERMYWRSFHGKAGELSSLFYDQYLKFNHQPKGLATYNELVRLLTGWYRQRQGWMYVAADTPRQKR